MAVGSGRCGLTFCVVGALVSVLAACAGRDPPKVDPNLFPSDYKAQILQIMPQIVADPTDMRDTGISELALTQIGDQRRYAACVRFNPRKSKTEYDGVQQRLAIFIEGNLAQFVQATPEQCGKAAYQPFPELEKLCFGDRCKSRQAR